MLNDKMYRLIYQDRLRTAFLIIVTKIVIISFPKSSSLRILIRWSKL